MAMTERQASKLLERMEKGERPLVAARLLGIGDRDVKAFLGKMRMKKAGTNYENRSRLEALKIREKNLSERLSAIQGEIKELEGK